MLGRGKGCGEGLREHHLRFLEGYFLWRLREPAHAYSLARELGPCHFMIWLKPSTVYAVLGMLEEMGLVSSTSATVGGRARRMYTTTKKGMEELEAMKRATLPPKVMEFASELLVFRKHIAKIGEKKE